MNRHLKYVLMTRLGHHVEDTKQFCAEPTTPVQDLLLDGVPYDPEDTATQCFFELMDSAEDNHQVVLGRLRVNVIDALQIHTKHRSDERSIALQEFLAAGDEGGSWAQLNLIFRQMTGSTLSEIANPANVLIHADDHGLDGDQWFAAVIEVASLGRQKFLMTNTVAMASTLEHLLFLIRDDILGRGDSCDWWKHKKFPSNPDDSISPKDLMPAFITINKNNQYFMQLMITCAEAEGEYEVDWERGRYKATRETIKAITAVAPPEVRNRIKASYLESEMGL